ncbi:unnamed protein product [Callosobruchus maculatus]|uniref:Peptidase S1 domain-containing protein n=1 Tax=Callosobruchus maculatus TaxID=64391 RepID=A0A653BGC7_CALMS|nr:unnamed protein product [Callosobruchus maculatus]
MNSILGTILLGCLISTSEGRPNERLKIIGGRNVTIEEYPYQVSIQNNGEHFCGGSIINTKYILTAAHCVCDDTMKENLTVRVGSSYRGRGGLIYKVKHIHGHPKYNFVYYDIAILELSEALKYGDGVKNIALASPDTILEGGTIAKATGWGALGERKPMPDQLQEVDLPIITRESCLAYEWLPENVICAGYKEGSKDTCWADSGGPLVVNDTVVGIVSFGAECGLPKHPGVYTNVAHFRSFIDPIVKNQQ